MVFTLIIVPFLLTFPHFLASAQKQPVAPPFPFPSVVRARAQVCSSSSSTMA
ncbi:hypothetical protein PybrP1_000152, partial [[Pythium] brassicae (nom. inval.)]